MGILVDQAEALRARLSREGGYLCGAGLSCGETVARGRPRGLDARYGLSRVARAGGAESPEIHANGIFNADGVMSSPAGLRWLVDEGETS